MNSTTRDRPHSMPWSVGVLACLLLSGIAWFVWNKRPFVSDAEKVCRVAELSGCPETSDSLVVDLCQIAWLERTMWSFGSLVQMPRRGNPNGAAFLRRFAHERGIDVCPEAEKIDREVVRQTHAIAESAARESPAEPPSTTRPRGRILSRAPAVDGDMDPAEISKAVRANISAFQACYDAALKRNATAGGMVEVRWTIRPTGKPTGVAIDQENFGDPKFVRCLRQAVAEMRFSSGNRADVEVVYPLIFPSSKESSKP